MRFPLFVFTEVIVNVKLILVVEFQLSPHELPSLFALFFPSFHFSFRYQSSSPVVGTEFIHTFVCNGIFCDFDICICELFPFR